MDVFKLEEEFAKRQQGAVAEKDEVISTLQRELQDKSKQLESISRERTDLLSTVNNLLQRKDSVESGVRKVMEENAQLLKALQEYKTEFRWPFKEIQVRMMC